jgi:hypothetical protein
MRVNQTYKLFQAYSPWQKPKKREDLVGQATLFCLTSRSPIFDWYSRLIITAFTLATVNNDRIIKQQVYGSK